MVTTRAAAMEARVEALEQRLEAQDWVWESISQQLSQLLGESGERGSGPNNRTVHKDESSMGSDNEHRLLEWGSTGHEWGVSHTPRRQELGRKIELPVFFGEDAYGWLTCVERYFHINEVDDIDKLELVLVALEREAL